MTIAEVSKKYGLSQDTLRYYERVGMIPPVHRGSGGRRDYTEEDCSWVEFACCLRSAGLPVEAAVEYLRLSKLGDATVGERRELLCHQREQLQQQMEAIQQTIARLDQKIARYDEAVKTGTLCW